MNLRFLLSHHLPAHEHRCVRIFGCAICARCFGMYPALLLGLAVLLHLDLRVGVDPSPRPFEGLVLGAAVLPALVDWIRGRLRPESGTNRLRLATGALLGLALARTVHLHARAPFESPALDVLVLLGLGVIVGEAMARGLR